MSPTPDELNQFLTRAFPHASLRVTAVNANSATLVQEVDSRQLRPGGTVSGPTLMGLMDAALYMAIFGAIGITPMAVTTNLNINFLRKPSAQARLIAECKLLKVGRTMAVGEVSVCSEGDPDPVAHATGTYALPAQQD